VRDKIFSKSQWLVFKIGLTPLRLLEERKTRRGLEDLKRKR
jgi:hypothetical protein